MKLKVGQVLAAFEAFGRVAGEKLPPKGAYWVARVIKRLEPEYAAAEGRRVALVKELGQEKDGSLSVPPERMKDFLDRWGPVLSEEIEVDAPRLKLEHLGEVPLLGSDMLAIEPFIEE